MRAAYTKYVGEVVQSYNAEIATARTDQKVFDLVLLSVIKQFSSSLSLVGGGLSCWPLVKRRRAVHFYPPREQGPIRLSNLVPRKGTRARPSGRTSAGRFTVPTFRRFNARKQTKKNVPNSRSSPGNFCKATTGFRSSKCFYVHSRHQSIYY